MEPDAAGGDLHASADLQELESEGVHLAGGQARCREPLTEAEEKHVGRRVKEETELVGREEVAGEAVGEDGVLEVLDPVLRAAPLVVEAIERLGLVGQGGDDEAGVIARSITSAL